MHIVIDTQPDPALWRAAFRHVLRRPMRRVRAFGAVFILCGAAIIVLSAAAENTLWVVGLFLLVIGIAYALLLPARAGKASVMLSRNQMFPVPIGGVPPEQLAQLREFVANREFVVRR